MGRPSKLTPDRHRLIIEAITKGATREVAANAAGITDRTLYEWRDRGYRDLDDHHPDPKDHTLADLRRMAEDQGVDLDLIDGRVTKAKVASLVSVPTRYSQFAQDLEKADARFEVEALERMREVGSEDWRMWMTLLERRRPERYARVVVTPESRPDDSVDPVKALEAGQARLQMLQGGQG